MLFRSDIKNANQIWHYDTAQNSGKKYFSDKSFPSFVHHENNFNDFTVQSLMPNYLSRQGPCMAVADVNKDGLDDIFLGGAKGYASSLFIQNKDGSFTKHPEPSPDKDSASEDVAVEFFDADNDGDKDMYVGSGGYEFGENDQALQDRLYINDGKGNFVKKDKALPVMSTSTGCVKAADIDGDGDMDLFVGGRVIPGKYPLPPRSYLLINDGKGNFTDQTNAIAPALKNIGMVTDAVWMDVNNDHQPDLIIVGEWMPIKVFINNKGVFTERDVPNSTGLWQTLYSTDINGDGLPDLLAGNYGHNTKLWSGKNGPVKLYVKDFDKNGSVEQIMAYTVDGKEYTFLAKDELERSLPVLKKAYLTYGEVAGKTVDYMFYDLFKDYVELKAETLGSAAFINDGHGGFKKIDLPEPLQLAPVFSFQQSPGGNGSGRSFVSGGNFYDVIPYEGRYDAQPMAMFDWSKNNELSYIPQTGLSGIKGQVRDLKWIHTSAFGDLLVVARNNQSLLFLKYSK